jgi:predicted ATPase
MAAVLRTLAVANYRSLRSVLVPLKGLNLITGANGSGKSNLYQALRLLADTAQSRVVLSLAREGLDPGPHRPRLQRDYAREVFRRNSGFCERSKNVNPLGMAFALEVVADPHAIRFRR